MKINIQILVLTLLLFGSCSLEQKSTTVNLKVVNSSENTINEIYLKSQGSTQWGENFLTDNLVSGEAVTFKSIDHEEYNIKAISKTGNVLLEDTLDLNGYDEFTLYIKKGN